jgi:hypothetical protein
MAMFMSGLQIVGIQIMRVLQQMVALGQGRLVSANDILLGGVHGMALLITCVLPFDIDTHVKYVLVDLDFV